MLEGWVCIAIYYDWPKNKNIALIPRIIYIWFDLVLIKILSITWT